MSFYHPHIEDELLGFLPKEAFLRPPKPAFSSSYHLPSSHPVDLSAYQDPADLCLDDACPEKIEAIFAARFRDQSFAFSSSQTTASSSSSSSSSVPIWCEPDDDCCEVEYVGTCGPCPPAHDELPPDFDFDDFEILDRPPKFGSAAVHGVRATDNQAHIAILEGLHTKVDEAEERRAQHETRAQRIVRKRGKKPRKKRDLGEENDAWFEKRSVLRRRKNAEPPRGEIVPIEGKGLGVVATTAIDPGDVIIAEAPFLVLDQSFWPEQVPERLRQLPVEDRKLFLSFLCDDSVASLDPHDIDRLSNIAQRNVIPIPIGAEDRSTFAQTWCTPARTKVTKLNGMFRTICRVNHSCRPNAQWDWNAENGLMELTALRPVASGQEVTACYLGSTFLPYEKRRNKLRDSWSFVCDCERCALSDDGRGESDARLVRIRELYKTYINRECIWDQEDPKVCAKKLEALIGLLLEEGFVSELKECYESLWTVSTRWGDLYTAREAGRRWLDYHAEMQIPTYETIRHDYEYPELADDWEIYRKAKEGTRSESDNDSDDEYTGLPRKKSRRFLSMSDRHGGSQQVPSTPKMTRARTSANLLIRPKTIASSSSPSSSRHITGFVKKLSL